MQLVNDNTCEWLNQLTKRINIKTINKNENCEWLIIGAGYTGLSAARKLGELHPNQRIIIVDAQLAGEGASGRNSGYLVDTTLNDGFTSNNELNKYNPEQVSKVISSDDIVIKKLYIRKRDMIDISNIPQHLIDALIVKRQVIYICFIQS